MGIRKYVIAGMASTCLIAGVIGVCEFRGKYKTHFDKVNGKNYLVVENRENDRDKFYRAYFDEKYGKKCLTVEERWGPYSERKEEERELSKDI